MGEAERGEHRPGGAAPGRRRLVRRPSAVLLGAIALLFVVLPFVEQVEGSELIEPLLLSLVLVASVVAVGDRPRAVRWAVVLMLPALLGKWMHHFSPGALPRWAFAGPGLVFVGFILYRLYRHVVRAPRVDSEVLCAGVSMYLMLAVLWAFANSLAEAIAPGSFAFTGPAAGQNMQGFTALYFSLVTLTTVGYGEIIPASGVTRMLAASEAVVGVLCVAVLMARLVSAYAPGAADAERDRDRAA